MLLRVLIVRVVLTGVAAGASLLAFPDHRPLVARIYLLVVGAHVFATLLRAASVLEGERPRLRLRGYRRPRQVERPEELRRLEDQVALAGATAADLYFRLRPVLREIAAERLAAGGRGELDERTAGAAWELLRPDLEPPRDAFARGLPPERLSVIVDAIEAL